MTIAILCPTRKRPELFKKMVDSARNTAHDKESLKFYAGIGHEDIPVYTNEVFKHLDHCIQFPNGLPTVHKWNVLAEYAMANADNRLFMLAADDMTFATPHWDKALHESYDRKPHVYHLLDSRDADGTPHPIVTREYIEAMGYFLPPVFMHWFVDTWTVEIGKACGAFSHLKDYMLVHDKPWDDGNPDDTHMHIRSQGWLNNDQWTNAHCQHFLETEKKRLAKKMTDDHHAEYMRQFVDM